jgi:hypothetical protein
VIDHIELQKFVSKIVNIKPSGGVIVRTGSNGNVLNLLKQQTLSFMQISQNPNSSQGDLDKVVQAIEGSLRTAQVLSIISEQQANQLIDDLYRLTDNNK